MPSRKVVAQLILLGVATSAALVPWSPQAVERWFSLGFYPRLQRVVTSVSNLLPVAILDVLSLAVVAVVVGALVRAVRSSRRAGRIGPVLSALRGLVVAAGIVYLMFLILWGFNYRRLPMTSRVQLVGDRPTADAVAGLGFQAAEQLNSLHDQAHRQGWVEPVRDTALREGFREAQRALSDRPEVVLGRAKETIFGPYFRWTGVDGMINPFGLEVLVNPDLLPFERPFVAAHEWSHLAGYADESEANFVGWLACMKGDVSTQYSGWLFLYWQVSGEVEADARAQLFEALATGPRTDLAAVAARIRSGELPWLRTAGWRVYDQYLKANRVEGGVRSYGAVVTLILRTRFEPGWTPVRQAPPTTAITPR